MVKFGTRTRPVNTGVILDVVFTGRVHGRLPKLPVNTGRAVLTARVTRLPVLHPY